MSSPAFGSSDPDRIGPRSKALRRVFDIAISASVLMLVMLAGLALRAALSLTAGMH